jgi:hypothetical protein
MTSAFCAAAGAPTSSVSSAADSHPGADHISSYVRLLALTVSLIEPRPSVNQATTIGSMAYAGQAVSNRLRATDAKRHGVAIIV